MDRVFGCDPAKRDWLLANRHFDLLDMAEVFEDKKRLDVADTRFDYGEERRVTVGHALGAVFTVVYTLRDPDLADHRLAGKPEGARDLWQRIRS